MNTSARAIRCAALGLVVIACGFWLNCHTGDIFLRTAANGTVFAPYSQELTELARLLMISGALLSLMAAGFWMASGTPKLPPPP